MVAAVVVVAVVVVVFVVFKSKNSLDCVIIATELMHFLCVQLNY